MQLGATAWKYVAQYIFTVYCLILKISVYITIILIVSDIGMNHAIVLLLDIFTLHNELIFNMHQINISTRPSI